VNVKELSEIPPWEWPKDAATVVLDTLTNRNASREDRLIASELAGDEVILNERLADALLNIVKSRKEPDDLRSRSAIALGPGLEIAEFEVYDDPHDPPVLSEPFVKNMQKALHQLYLDAEVPTDVRRSVLEASVRNPQDWHTGAVRSAYESDDENWRLTSVFCMRNIKGFEDEILKSLTSKDYNILYNAIVAAGNWELDAAWPTIARLVRADDTEKHLRIAAIEAVMSIRPAETDILEPLVDSYDEDISEAAMDALAEAGFEEDWDSEDEEDEDEEEDDFEDDDLDYDDEDDEDDEKK
jgi:hypothetical protein